MTRKRERPFKILGLQQVAIGWENKEILETFFIDLLGIEKISSFESKKENVRESICSIGESPNGVELDLMEPIIKDSKPAPHQPPLNHIGLWVDKIEEAYNWLAENGVRMAPGGIREGASGHRVFFTHPKGSAEHPIGSMILLEFVQHPNPKSEAS